MSSLILKLPWYQKYASKRVQNLKYHVLSKKAENIAELHATRFKQPHGGLLSMGFDRKTITAHGWIVCAVLGLVSFGSIEEKASRYHSKHKSICGKTLMQRLRKLMQLVKVKIDATS